MGRPWQSSSDSVKLAQSAVGPWNWIGPGLLRMRNCSVAQQGLATQIFLSAAVRGPDLPEQLAAEQPIRTDANDSTVSHITCHGHRGLA